MDFFHHISSSKHNDNDTVHSFFLSKKTRVICSFAVFPMFLFFSESAVLIRTCLFCSFKLAVRMFCQVAVQCVLLNTPDESSTEKQLYELTVESWKALSNTLLKLDLLWFKCNITNTAIFIFHGFSITRDATCEKLRGKRAKLRIHMRWSRDTTNLTLSVNWITHFY